MKDEAKAKNKDDPKEEVADEPIHLEIFSSSDDDKPTTSKRARTQHYRCKPVRSGAANEPPKHPTMTHQATQTEVETSDDPRDETIRRLTEDIKMLRRNNETLLRDREKARETTN